MSNVEDIENRVKELSTTELAIFRGWFRQFDSDSWNRETEADVLAGRLDHLVDAALEQHRSGGSAEL